MTSLSSGLHCSSVSPILVIIALLPFVYTQQIGSFNTVIYLNGAPLSPSQVSCGQSGYCCASGQSCAWDDAGQPACCAIGNTCTGNAAAQGQYHQTQAVVQTQTVYETKQTDCGCETTTTTPVVNVAPAVVVPLTTTATVQQYYTPTTTTATPYLYTSTTTSPVAEAATGGNCAGGYTTVTEVNVGQPTRIVGCYVIINGAQSNRNGGGVKSTLLVGLTSVIGLLIAEVFL